MSGVCAILTMLHEGETRNSARRRFRSEPVIAWTLDRLRRAQSIQDLAILCWEDQIPDVQPLAEQFEAYVLAKGPRVPVPGVEAIDAALRWSDGWRASLGQCCWFDRGFHGEWIAEIVQKLDARGIVLVDASSGLLDPQLVDRAVDHLDSNAQVEFAFSPAAPGLGAPVFKRSLIERVREGGTHPGKLFHYNPDIPGRDPIVGDAAVATPARVARTRHSFRLDSARQIERLSHATVSLNGQLKGTLSEELVERIEAADQRHVLPRDVIVELTTRRSTRPVFAASTHLTVQRADMSAATFSRIVEQLGSVDDIRLTLSGVGDPMLHPEFAHLLERARDAGISAIHVQSDFLPDSPETIAAMVEHRVDVVSVVMPAITRQTYERMMGVDRFTELVNNVARLLTIRSQRKQGTPLVVPVFHKMRENLGEMEAWYDQWIRTLSAAVIVGPSDLCAQIPAMSVSDMAPGARAACRRLESRLTILADGTVVSCENDVLGKQPIGNVDRSDLREIWEAGFSQFRARHRGGNSLPVLCQSCSDWHRP